MSEKSAQDKQGNPSEEPNFDEVFDSIIKSGGQQSDDIDLQSIDKWFKEANLDKDITNQDTSTIFAKIAKKKNRINKEEFREMLNALAKEKNKDFSELEEKLKHAGRNIYKKAKQQLDEQIKPQGSPEKKTGILGNLGLKKDPQP